MTARPVPKRELPPTAGEAPHVSPGRRALLASAVLLGLLVCGVLYALVPGSPDQYEHDYMGWRVLEGAVPYVDVVDNNWPGSMWLHALSTWLFGHHLHSSRLLDFALMVVGLAFLADLLRRTRSDPAWLWALFLFPWLYTAGHGYWFAGQRDGMAASFLFVAAWTHWRAWESGRVRRQAATGLVVAAAMLIKPTTGATLALLALHGLVCARPVAGGRPMDALRHAAVAAGAAAAGLVIAVLVLLATGTTGQALIDCAWTFNVTSAGHASGVGAPELVSKLARVHAGSWHWITVGALLSIGWDLRRARGRDVAAALLLPALWIAGLVSYAAQMRGLGYHLAPAYMALLGVLMTGLGALTVAASKGGARAPVAIGLAVVAVAGTALKTRGAFEPSVRRLAGTLTEHEHLGRYGAGDGLTYADVAVLVERLPVYVPPEDPLLVLGTQSAVGFLLPRREPTRFYYTPVLADARSPDALVERWNARFRAEVESCSAPVCLVSRTALDSLLNAPHPVTRESGRRLQRLLARRYVRIGAVGDADAYRRDDVELSAATFASWWGTRR